MKLHPRVTKTAVELVKRFEGLRRRAARLPDGGWTIGYGHTRTAREGVEVSEEEAELLLYFDLSEVATRVEAWTFTPLNQNQFEALTSFAFNIGVENFRRSTVLKRVNEGQYLQAAAAMELWRKTEVDGEAVVVDALVRRRAAEKAHFLTPPEGFKPSPSPVLRPTFDFSVIEAAAQSHAAARAADVTTSMDGDDAIAHVERAVAAEAEPETGPAADAQLATLAEPEAAPEADAAPAEDFAAAPVVTHEDLGVPPVPDAPPSSNRFSGFGFKGFEPPPPRFNREFEPAAPVDEQTAPASVPANEAFAPPQQGLFERPSPAPLPSLESMPVERVIRTQPDGDQRRGRRVTRQKGDDDGASILKNAPVLYGSVGCLGVALFALTITSMLTGKPSVAHLLVGLVAVALMTFAGIYFLLKRSGSPLTSDAAAKAAREDLTPLE